LCSKCGWRENGNTKYKFLQFEITDSSSRSYFYDLSQVRTWKYEANAVKKEKAIA